MASCFIVKSLADTKTIVSMSTIVVSSMSMEGFAKLQV